ncbi:STAS domain-containing protein [Streptomyces sp. KY70]|uniref:STAS domain-containing protein n=1 Tax=Streptomyces sp. KY70 TaxID=2772432 RepID=UPI001AFB17C3|nr:MULTISPECIES: STAS domain-containing protein [unclassified Streptomyces]CAD5930411.1 Anti-sigma factor antagonist [Streptomyces sp. KY70]CAD5989003.1 Anti-sigma factor antagonist [Streptomyces sp. KY75]
MFAVDVRRDTRGVVFTLRGDLDFHSVVQLYEAGEEELGTGRETGSVVVDCAHLTYCDSTGISALLKLYHQMSAQDGVLCLASVTDNLNRLFELTGLNQIFCLHTDAEGALNAHRHVPGAVASGADSAARTGTEHGG